MPFTDFLKYLLVSIGISVVLYFLFDLFLPLTPYLDFLGWSIFFFTVLALMAYLFANKSSKLKNSSAFLVLIIGNVFLKMITSFLFVAIYAKYNEPPDRFFLVPFLITYLVFTGYEIYFMSIQAHDTK